MHQVFLGEAAGWYLAGCSCGWEAPKPRNLKVCSQADGENHRRAALAQPNYQPPACGEPECPVCSSHN